MRHFTFRCPLQRPQNFRRFSQTKGFSLRTRTRHCSTVSVSFACILRWTFISSPYMKAPFPTLQFQTNLYDYAGINIRDGVRSLSHFAHAGLFFPQKDDFTDQTVHFQMSGQQPVTFYDVLLTHLFRFDSRFVRLQQIDILIMSFRVDNIDKPTASSRA